jgi:MerR family transcriptional regulator, light-induced transcriptional regulator
LPLVYPMTGIPMINAAVIPDISRLAAPLTEWTSMAMSMFSKGSAASNEDFRETFKGTPAECQASILAVIESEIVPRLLGAQRVDKSHLSLVPSTRAMPTQQEIAAFLELCIGSEPMAAQAFVDRLLKDGLNTEHIFLELITPTARALGARWDDDTLDFMQVTHGLVQLHAITHEIGFAFEHGPRIQGDIKRAMIASAPGSEHLLGPTIVSEFFRRGGWQVVVEISPSAKELAQAVASEWFDTVGLSVSINQQLNGLDALVAQIRQRSRNPRLSVLLGGPVFTLREFQASTFGADGICTDAKDAVAMAVATLPKD